MQLSAIIRLIEECEQHPCAAPNVDIVADARADLIAWQSSVGRSVEIAELEAALAAIHATSRRVTHHYEWYLDGVRQSPGVYVVMRVGDAPDAPVTPF